MTKSHNSILYFLEKEDELLSNLERKNRDIEEILEDVNDSKRNQILIEYDRETLKKLREEVKEITHELYEVKEEILIHLHYDFY